jgi:hypothetical protein
MLKCGLSSIAVTATVSLLLSVTLINVTPSQAITGVNFTNILRALFWYKSFAQSFFVLTLHFRFELLLAKEYWRKCAHKMLVKLTTDYNANGLDCWEMCFLDAFQDPNVDNNEKQRLQSFLKLVNRVKKIRIKHKVRNKPMEIHDLFFSGFHK